MDEQYLAFATAYAQSILSETDLTRHRLGDWTGNDRACFALRAELSSGEWLTVLFEPEGGNLHGADLEADTVKRYPSRLPWCWTKPL